LNARLRLHPLAFDECQEVGVELVAVRRGQTVGRARVDLERGVSHDFRGEKGGRSDGNDLVVGAVDEQRGDVDLFQIFREIGFGKGLDAIERGFQSDLHALEPELIAQSLRELGAGAVAAIERQAQILIELKIDQ